MVKQPELRLEPKIVQYGNCLLLETAVECDPEPKVGWEKNEQPIPDADPQFIIKTEALNVANTYRLTLDIQNFDKSLAGLYKCLIENEHGKTSATFTVAAGDVPEFPEKPKIVQKNKGEILAIKIKSKSHTEPTVIWTKNDQLINENDRIKLVTKKGENPGEYIFMLEIKGPIKEDEANYKCTVKNGDGSNSQSLELSFD